MAETFHKEPTLGSYANTFGLYFAAIRPAFLLATLAACSIGLAGAAYSGIEIQPFLALITVSLVMLLHAAVNVLNDYFDALNGTDDANEERIYPFTGGSRFIQNGLLSVKQTARFGYVMLWIAILGGLWLVYRVGAGLLYIGALGVLLGWGYSAAPLKFNSRGLGEVCVLLGFLGVVVGTDYVMREAFAFTPVAVGLSYALLVMNLLYINQFPDRRADALVGKHHLVVRLPITVAVRAYFMIAMLAAAWIFTMVVIAQLPLVAMVSILPFFLTLRAYRLLSQFASTPTKLSPAIKMSLASMLIHALLLTIILLWKSL